jgi:hypothetical protein
MATLRVYFTGQVLLSFPSAIFVMLRLFLCKLIACLNTSAIPFLMLLMCLRFYQRCQMAVFFSGEVSQLSVSFAQDVVVFLENAVTFHAIMTSEGWSLQP